MIALKDEKVDVRRAAAEALGDMGAEAVGPLCKALTDSDPNVRFDAAHALGRIGPQLIS
jgi:HEAT repeat protein